jgi:hypothetical protein
MPLNDFESSGAHLQMLFFVACEMIPALFFPLISGDLIMGAFGAAVAPTPTSGDDKAAVVRQDGEVIPTITMGDMNQYYNYDVRIFFFSISFTLTLSQGDDRAEKRSVAIFPTGFVDTVPEGGMHIVFGPDMQNDMGKTLSEKCKDSKQMQDCQTAITKLLQESTLNLHT